MKIRAVIGFNDLVAHVWREQGEEWEADESRLESLKGTKWGDLAERVPEPEAEPENEPENESENEPEPEPKPRRQRRSTVKEAESTE